MMFFLRLHRRLEAAATTSGGGELFMVMTIPTRENLHFFSRVVSQVDQFTVLIIGQLETREEEHYLVWRKYY